MSHDEGRWAPGYDACVNCGTVDRDHAGAGCCDRCLPTWRKKRRAERWDPTAAGAAARAPMAWLLKGLDGPSPRILQLHKDEVLRQIGQRLTRLQEEERLRTGAVTPLDLEDELNRVWAMIRPRPTHKTESPFARGASWIAAPFDRRQMNAVAALLVGLAAHVPQRVDFSAWWESVGRPAYEERDRRAAARLGGEHDRDGR
jgi:hypothetical protein